MFREELIYFIFPICFALWWLFIMWLVSFSGGWSSLARQYPLPQGLPPARKGFRFQSLRLGLFTNYSHSINIFIHDEGIELRPLVVYSFFHKPIFIRWESIEQVAIKGNSFGYLSFYLEKKQFRIWGGSIDWLYSSIRQTKKGAQGPPV